MSGEWLFGTCGLGKFRNNTLGFDSKLLLDLADSATLHSHSSQKGGISTVFCLLQKREVLLIVRLNQQLILPSHLSFALLLLSQVHVYCLFFPHPFLFISSRFFSWAQSVMLRWLLFLFAQSHVCKIPFICLLFSLLFLITALLFASSSYGFINTM